MSEGISFGEASFRSGVEFGNSDDEVALTRARMRHFSKSVLSVEAWFQSADELIEAMNLLGRNVERFWRDLDSIRFGFDATTGTRTKHRKPDESQKTQNGDAPAKHNLINQQMMLACFAIENLCKGCLVNLLTAEEEKEIVKKGTLPKTLKGNHDVLEFVEMTGLTLSYRERDLLKRIGIANWKGRYPSPTKHNTIKPFIQWQDDTDRINKFLRRLRAHVEMKVNKK